MSISVRSAAWMLSVSALTLLSGCSGGQPTAPVTGKVTHEGKPVAGGMVTFAPVASGTEATAVGRPASGEVKSDGTFVLTTYQAGDGAVLGRHKITYFPPATGSGETASSEPGKHDEGPAASPYKGLMPKEEEVEVKAGTNDITIELIPNPQAKFLVKPPE